MTQTEEGNGKGEPQVVPMKRADAEVEDAMVKARGSGRYMVAIWHVAEGLVNLFRKTHNFPLQDLDIAQGLLHAEVNKIKASEGGLGANDLAKPPAKPQFYTPPDTEDD